MGPHPDRVYMFGARYAELSQEDLPPIKPATELRVLGDPLTTDTWIGKVVAVNPGFGVDNYINYHVDNGDTRSAVAGFCKRVAVDIPSAVQSSQDDFFMFVRNWCESNLKPLPADTDFSVDNWLAHTDYTESRKTVLRDIAAEHVTPRRVDRECCKSFIKDEFYDGVKYARTINARTDWFKAYCGPMFKQIESVIFKDAAFIKYIPVSERPKYISERLVGHTHVSTSDFKSFEGSFTPRIIRNVEGYMYQHMLQSCPEMAARMQDVIRVMTARNCLKFRRFHGKVNGVRMSGEMCTSLGNGFTNMMLMKYYCHKTHNECVSIFEGDDGIHLSKDKFLDPVAFFAKLGFNLDFARATSVQTAKFCGARFDDDLNCQIDAVKTILNTPWLKSAYTESSPDVLVSLLKARAMSILYRCPHCPIVSSFAHWIMRAATGFKPRIEALNNYQRKYMTNAVNTYKFVLPSISMGARVQYATTFGMSLFRKR